MLKKTDAICLVTSNKIMNDKSDSLGGLKNYIHVAYFAIKTFFEQK